MHRIYPLSFYRFIRSFSSIIRMFLVFWFHARIEDARIPTVLQLQLRRCTAASASIAASVVRVLNVTKEKVKKNGHFSIFLRTKNSEKTFKSVSQRTKQVASVCWHSYDNLRYPKCDGEVEKNDSKGEKAAAISLIYALHLIFVSFEFWTSYRIISIYLDMIIFQKFHWQINGCWKSSKSEVHSNRCYVRRILRYILRIWPIPNFNWLTSRISKELFPRWIDSKKRWRLKRNAWVSSIVVTFSRLCTRFFQLSHHVPD